MLTLYRHTAVVDIVNPVRLLYNMHTYICVIHYIWNYGRSLILESRCIHYMFRIAHIIVWYYYCYLDAFEIVAGHTDAVLLGRRIFDRIHSRTVHVVPDVGHRVPGDTHPVFQHVRMDAGLATVAADTARGRAEGHGIVEVVAW